MGLLNYKGICQINRDILINSLNLFAEHKVDIVDAIVFATAKYQEWEMFSFDQDMNKFNS
jgi:predicted nucleic acid-binding protein